MTLKKKKNCFMANTDLSTVPKIMMKCRFLDKKKKSVILGGKVHHVLKPRRLGQIHVLFSYFILFYVGKKLYCKAKISDCFRKINPDTNNKSLNWHKIMF